VIPIKRRLKVAKDNTPAVAVPEWFADNAIRSMVADNTDCFGAWSARSTECGKCPLSGWCRNAKAASLTLLATKITVTDPASPSAVSKPVAKLDAAVSAANAPTAARTVPNPGAGGTMKAQFDGTCAETGKPIKKGDAVKYVQGKGLVLTTA
jgi:hypothetical protein